MICTYVLTYVRIFIYVFCDCLYFVPLEISVRIPNSPISLNENVGILQLPLFLTNPSSFDEIVEIRTRDGSAIGKLTCSYVHTYVWVCKIIICVCRRRH